MEFPTTLKDLVEIMRLRRQMSNPYNLLLTMVFQKPKHVRSIAFDRGAPPNLQDQGASVEASNSRKPASSVHRL